MSLLGNMKPRELWCPFCRKTTVSADPNPRCNDKYKTPLVTVVKSSIDGQRITGADELGSRSR